MRGSSETGPLLGPGPEFELIRRLAASSGALPDGVLLGPGDDCAVLEGGVVISVDLSVEGVHFLRDWITLEEAGYRAAAGALSDIAAMAAEPLGILLSMALRPEEARSGAPAFQAGAQEACAREGVLVLGGDLSSTSGPATLDVVAVGRAADPVLRAGARPGDDLWVTGWLGGSAAAVGEWAGGGTPSPGLREAFVRPRPRIREMRWLSKRGGIRAAIDLSDGLAGDAGHLAAASGVAIHLEAGAIPLHPELAEALSHAERRLHFALGGGEDYEVCFAAKPGSMEPLVDSFEETFGIPLSRIGGVGEGRGVALVDDQGIRTPLEGGYSHFKEGGQG